MNSNPATLKPATEAHAAMIPDLAFSTGPVSYAYIFGEDRGLFDAFILQSWKTTDTFFSHRETTIAVENDNLRGIEIGYSGKRYYQLREGGMSVSQALIETGGATLEQLQAVGQRSHKNDFQLPYVPPDAYYVMAIAVTEESRRRGIGAQLLNHAFEQARDAGLRVLHLDVLSDNKPAVDLYLRMGMTCMAESSVPELRREHNIPPEYRMVKDLA
jgi:ribosomal protein S18 acetylase RimI-like enzyme